MTKAEKIAEINAFAKAQAAKYHAEMTERCQRAVTEYEHEMDTLEITYAIAVINVLTGQKDN